jgi:hypothetical protein
MGLEITSERIMNNLPHQTNRMEMNKMLGNVRCITIMDAAAVVSDVKN